MNFQIFGPFDLPLKSDSWIGDSKENKNNFKELIDAEQMELSEACGCYLFAIRAGKGFKPWYVGLAASQSLFKEIYTNQKIKIYNEVFSKIKKGSPVIFLIAATTNRGKFVKPSVTRKKLFGFVEDLLIGRVIQKNPELMNIKKTKHIKDTIIPQVLNTPIGPPILSDRKFKKAIS